MENGMFFNKGGDYMARRFREARKLKNIKLIEAAKLLGVSQPTLSAWEGERKSPSIDALEKMADLYGVTADFLLGRPDEFSPDPSQPVSLQQLRIMNGKPVWSPVHGWMLVNATGQHLLRADGTSMPFSDAEDIFVAPKFFSEAFPYSDRPLSRDELLSQTEIWLEPISPDPDLRSELRGWYRIKNRFAENEYGNRFSLDTYGIKWLAFNEIINI